LRYRQDHWRAQQSHASEPAIEIREKKVKKSGMNEKDKERCRLAGLRVAWMEWNIHIHSSVPQQMSDLDGALPSVRRTDAIGARPPALPLRARTFVGYDVRQ